MFFTGDKPDNVYIYPEAGKQMNRIKASIVQGYGVASGKNGDPRFPGGTIRMQMPFFKTGGIDLQGFFPGTLNADISPHSYEIIKPLKIFRELKWSSELSAENFFFFNLRLFFGRQNFDGYIYMPDPDTKEEHFQRESILEMILPEITGISYGNTVLLEVPETQMKLF